MTVTFSRVLLVSQVEGKSKGRQCGEGHTYNLSSLVELNRREKSGEEVG